MEYTRPQLRLLTENRQERFLRFARMIEANPGSLLQILDDARGARFNETDLIQLLAWAQKKKIISLNQYKQYSDRLGQSKTGRIRRTGKTGRRDTALLKDKSDDGEVTCAFCKDSVPAHRADLVKGGAWMCNVCSGS